MAWFSSTGYEEWKTYKIQYIQIKDEKGMVVGDGWIDRWKWKHENQELLSFGNSCVLCVFFFYYYFSYFTVISHANPLIKGKKMKRILLHFASSSSFPLVSPISLCLSFKQTIEFI